MRLFGINPRCQSRTDSADGRAGGQRHCWMVRMPELDCWESATEPKQKGNKEFYHVQCERDRAYINCELSKFDKKLLSKLYQQDLFIHSYVLVDAIGMK